MSRPLAETARAFAPGHVTGIFRPEMTCRDPRGRGSVGAGIVLELGAVAEARFVPGGRTTTKVVGDGPGPWPISGEVARRLAPSRGGLTVRLMHDLPVGQGFGMSAAGALATALAVRALTGVSKSRAVEVAHLAELFGGGGLGGVAAILGGGLEVRTRAGVPPLGRVAHRAFAPRMLVGIVGRPIPSPSVLGDRRALARIAAASRGWERTIDGAPEVFLGLAERFTDRAGLASPAVRAVVRGLRRRGAWAAQAMFGESFFAVPRSPPARAECLDWLRHERIRAVEIGAARTGAHLQPRRPD